MSEPYVIVNPQNNLISGNYAIINTYSNNNSSSIPINYGPCAWFRSDLGITTSSGNVTAWNDQSGFRQNVASIGPAIAYSASGGVNNLPYLTFNDSSLQGAFAFPGGTNSQENFIVANYSSLPVTNAYLIDFGSNKNITLLNESLPGKVSIYNGVFLTNSTVISANTNFVTDTVWSNVSASDSIAINGGTATVGTGGSFSSSSQLTIGNYGAGGANGLLGLIYEVIIYPRILSSSERAGVLSYIWSRYGIVT